MLFFQPVQVHATTPALSPEFTIKAATAPTVENIQPALIENNSQSERTGTAGWLVADKIAGN